MRREREGRTPWAITNPRISWLVRGFFVGCILGLAAGVYSAWDFVGRGESSVGAILFMLQFFALVGLIAGSAIGGGVGIIVERRKRD